jgi:putative thioredoxin
MDDMDVTEATFERDVLERSRTVPVVVDFWAEWCGPCRQLGPLLEQAIAKRAGAVELAKVDVDSNPRLAQIFRIQGIPAVKAFRDGRVASEFVGAQPAQAIEAFLDGLVPSEADTLVGAGDEESLRRAVELEPSRADAAVPLARLLHARGEADEAQAILERVPGSFAADGLLARIDLERRLAAGETPAPGLAEAFTALDGGDPEHGLDLLLAALTNADGHKDDVRRVIIGVLDELGVDSDLARATRRRLAAALY